MSSWSRPEDRGGAGSAERGDAAPETTGAPGDGPHRGQVEPIAAIAAVFAIAVAVALYAGVAGQITPESDDTDADATMHRLADGHLADGVIETPPRIDHDRLARPGEAVNVSVDAGRWQWSTGPSPPPDADVARRPVTVATGPGEQAPGWLTLEVWET